MADLTWKDSIIKILEKAAASMHYLDITDSIVAEGLRKELGATPADTVNAVITTEIKTKGEKALFARTAPGEYILRKHLSIIPKEEQPQTSEENNSGQEIETDIVINSFGMFWRRENVLWSNNPKLLGQQSGGNHIDFSYQIGVYILYDEQRIVYVGRAIEQNLGKRIYQHTVDRLNGRWNRFSWFGLKRVLKDAKLSELKILNISPEIFVSIAEALLIEALEPPQNRKGGDRFRAVEYLQVKDPEIKKREIKNILDQLKNKLE
ncbi:hypothetical protein KJ633_08260 [bacterium]|nr:hypothetical protein [bacterium]MBU3956441.1 hypothetical protein [bacterium]